MAARFCSKLEEAILRDPGQRGIKHLFIKGQLYQTLFHLEKTTRHIVLGTGFPVTDFDPPTESDGPPGCMVLAYSLLKHDPYRKVTVIYDNIHQQVMGQLIDSFNDEFRSINPNIDQKLNAFNTKDIPTSEHFFRLPQFHDIDHMIASELGGPNKEGKNKTSRNTDITDRCGLTPWIFDYAFKNKICLTTGIGDGGNEVGMGKVIDKVEKNIPNGTDIACAVSTDFLITAGVSNWGAEAIALALHCNYMMTTLDTSYQVYCNDEFHEKMYMLTAQYGAADPKRKVFDGGCDGMEYPIHKQMWDDLCKINEEHQNLLFPKLS